MMVMLKKIETLTPWKIFLFFFAYTFAVAIVVQSLVIPFIFPHLHAGYGMLNSIDSIDFHWYSVMLSNKIKQNGWSEWQLRPTEYKMSIVGILSVLYTCIAPKPWVLIPLNSALHAASGLILYLFVYRLSDSPKISFLSVLPFVFFFTPMLWYTQIHKDGFSILGSFLIFYSWTLFTWPATWKHYKQTLFALFLIYSGVALLWIIRPYILQILSPLTFVATLVTSFYLFIQWRSSKLNAKQTAAAIVVLFTVSFSVKSFSSAGFEIAEIISPAIYVSTKPKVTTTSKPEVTTTSAKEQQIQTITNLATQAYHKQLAKLDTEITKSSNNSKSIVDLPMKHLLNQHTLDVLTSLKYGTLRKDTLAVLHKPLIKTLAPNVHENLYKSLAATLDEDTQRLLRTPFLDILKTTTTLSKNDMKLIEDKTLKDFEKPFEDILPLNLAQKIHTPIVEIIIPKEKLSEFQITFIHLFDKKMRNLIEDLGNKASDGNTTEITNRKEVNQLNKEIERVITTTLGNSINIVSSKESCNWNASLWIPNSIDASLATLTERRKGYINTQARTNLDTNVIFCNAIDIIAYIPRTLEIVFLAPFPNTWTTVDTTGSSIIMRWVAFIEMALTYCSLLFFPYSLWKWRKRFDMWVVIVFSFGFLTVLSLATPNLGTLYRMRYGFLMIIVAVSLASGCSALFDYLGRKGKL